MLGSIENISFGYYEKGVGLKIELTAPARVGGSKCENGFEIYGGFIEL